MASIEEAKDLIKATPISSVISFYHPITKRGANFEGICPFHGDSHPSLKINDGKGIYKCFACGAAGDSIRFVQDKLNVSFIEAIKDIASNLGVNIEEQKKNKNPKYEMGLRVLQAANKLYKKIALESKPQAYKDFCQKRNLNEDSQNNFQIGFATGSNALVSYLNSIPNSDKEMAIKSAKEIGLIRDSKHGGGHYDFYRDRIMFPIWDHSGKVRGFSSRATKEDQVPKYLNSGESFIFDKGNILYGFNLAKNHIRDLDSVMIVEGNMDVIMLHQFGFKNSVATMGVSLSSSSIKLLKNMTENFYLAMDSDNAGIKAMTRINEELLENNIIAKYISFAPMKDPDEFLNEYGRIELQKRIEDAPTFLDFLIANEIPEQIPGSTENKLSLLKNVFQILRPLGSNLMATEKVITVAKSLGLKSSNDDILQEYKNYLAQGGVSTPPANQGQSFNPNPLENDAQHIPYEEEDLANKVHFDSALPILNSERTVLLTLIEQPECILANQMTEILDKIQHFEVKRIVQWLKKIYLEIDETDFPLFVREKMKEALPEEIRKILIEGLNKYSNIKLDSKVIDKTMADLSIKLDEGVLLQQIEQLQKKHSEVSSDEEGLIILNEVQQLRSKLNAIRNK